MLPLLASAVSAVPAGGYRLPPIHFRPTRGYGSPQINYNRPVRQYVPAYNFQQVYRYPDQDIQYISGDNDDSREVQSYSNDRDSSEESYGSCSDGYLKRIDGKCVRPVVSRNVYLYNAPQQRILVRPPPYIPEPKIHYNYVFVKSPDPVSGPKPLIVPPTQEKTLVYVLSKNPDYQNQEVIELSDRPDEPEVYFVNYKDGENPTLPGGIDLRTALRQSGRGSGSSEEGRYYGGGDSGSVFSGEGGSIGSLYSSGRGFIGSREDRDDDLRG